MPLELADDLARPRKQRRGKELGAGHGGRPARRGKRLSAATAANSGAVEMVA